jgi:hypothetical protein
MDSSGKMRWRNVVSWKSGAGQHTIRLSASPSPKASGKCGGSFRPQGVGWIHRDSVFQILCGINCASGFCQWSHAELHVSVLRNEHARDGMLQDHGKL